MEVYKIGDIMAKSNHASEKKERTPRKKIVIVVPKPELPENVFALNADREVREKLRSGWKLKVVRTGKLSHAPREEGVYFLDQSSIEGLREMKNGRLIGMSSRITMGEEYADIWTLIPPEEK